MRKWSARAHNVKGGAIMSEREMCVKLLDHVPEFKLRYVLAYLQGLTADEMDDDAFCEQLYQEYLSDPDKGQAQSLEEVAMQLGVSM